MMLDDEAARFILAARREARLCGVPAGIEADDVVSIAWRYRSDRPVPEDAAHFRNWVRQAVRWAIRSEKREQTRAASVPAEVRAVALTPRELELARAMLTADGYEDAGRLLGLSPKTCRNIGHSIIRKLGERSIRQAVVRLERGGNLTA